MDTKQIRHCALWHEGLGIVRTKVLFKDEKGIEHGYWMDGEVYNAISLGVKATPEDYKKFGRVDEALDTDIYSLK